MKGGVTTKRYTAFILVVLAVIIVGLIIYIPCKFATYNNSISKTFAQPITQIQITNLKDKKTITEKAEIKAFIDHLNLSKWSPKFIWYNKLAMSDYISIDNSKNIGVCCGDHGDYYAQIGSNYYKIPKEAYDDVIQYEKG